MSVSDNRSKPVLLSDSGPDIFLEPVALGQSADGGRREDFIQQLVHDHPSTLPMLDIEPAFTPLISVCRELPTSSGYLDNLWMTPEGGIVLGECKLVRNPQARREVVAQALDYAQAIKGWHYADLEAAVSKSVAPAASTLWEAVAENSRLDEAQFVDSVERRLRTGRFMILIIGDGIREGVEELTDYLQLHAGLHTGLALVDLSIWRDPDGRMMVVPRVPMKTVLVERGIVSIDETGRAKIEASAQGRLMEPARKFSSSEPEFYEQLDQQVPGASTKLASFLTGVEEVGIEPEFLKSLVLRFFPSPDVNASAGYIETNGRFHAADGWGYANNLGRADVGRTYLEGLARLIGGSLREYPGERAPFLLGSDGKGARIDAFFDTLPEWITITNEFIETLQTATPR